MIEELITEVQELQQAKDLLNRVYLEIGPYKKDGVSDKTWREVCRFFKFDDSE